MRFLVPCATLLLWATLLSPHSSDHLLEQAALLQQEVQDLRAELLTCRGEAAAAQDLRRQVLALSALRDSLLASLQATSPPVDAVSGASPALAQDGGQAR